MNNNVVNSLIKGDCLEELKRINDNSIDLILTDAPYLISRKSDYQNTKLDKYKNHSIDFGEWDKKEIDIEELFKEFKRVLKKGGTILFFYDLFKMQEIKETAEELKFKQSRIGIWIKNNPVPINSKVNYLSNSKEFFISFVKGNKKTFNAEYHKGVYHFPLCHGKERTIHKTQKPLKLFEELVKEHSNEKDVILDCFAGSGTSAIAAINTNRNYICIEKDDTYFDLMVERVEKRLKEKGMIK